MTQPTCYQSVRPPGERTLASANFAEAARREVNVLSLVCRGQRDYFGRKKGH